MGKSNDTGEADRDPYVADPGGAVNPDIPASVGAEGLDEDRMSGDPAEGVTPPDDWSVADSTGTTPREQRQGQTLDERLDQEEPDVGE